MEEKSVQHKRVESALHEVMCEAVSTLNDAELAGLTVTRVEVTRGKYDSTVFIDGSELPEKEDRQRILAKLQKASGYLARYCTAAEGWYKSPKLHFKIDDSLEAARKMDAIFEKIHKGKES